jgi:hypothetical protein
MEPLYYTTNPLTTSKLNWTFERLHFASKRQFEKWARDVCAELVRIFDETGMPPKAGKTAQELSEDFSRLVKLDIKTQHGALDEHTGDHDTLINTIRVSAADHFFPNIFLAKDNMGSKQISVMDKLRDPESMVKLLRRNLKRDGYYRYAPTVDGDSLEKYLQHKSAGVGVWFFKSSPNKHTYKKVRAKVSEVRALVKKGALDEKVLAGIALLADTDTVYVREFEKSRRVFPLAFQSFQTGLASAPTNFPAAVAKAIYTLYGTEVVQTKKPLVIFDPSMGFGGRLLGALSLVDRDITYIGCDPNTLNIRKDEDGLSRYAALEGIFKNCVKERTDQNFDSRYFICGSEVIHEQPEFQAYKGKVDLVFTSPPYFNAEIYSDDASQSSKKFGSYPSWREHFLARTLQTAAEWLAPNRYLIVNIARVADGNHFYPLEEETIGICEALGLRHVETKKMVLSHSPGAGRTRNGSRTSWHVAKIHGKPRKCEPVLVFLKTKPVPEQPQFVFSDLYTPRNAERREISQAA